MTSTNVNVVIYDNFLTPRSFASDNIDISFVGGDIYLNALPSLTNATNIGNNGPFSAKSTNNVLNFKNLAAGTFIVLANTNSNIVVNRSPLITNATGGLFIGKTLENILNFKNLLAGSNITFTTNATIVQINSAAGGGVIGATNLGGITGGFFIDTSNNLLNFKNLVAGTAISLVNNDSLIRINYLTNTNVVINATNGLFLNRSANGVLVFRTLLAGTFMVLVSNNSMVQINSTYVNTNVVIGATNIGGNSNGLFINTSSDGILTFKNLVAGSFISIDSSSPIRINSNFPDGIFAGQNVGIGEGQIYSDISQHIMIFKNLVGDSSIIIDNTDSTININAVIIIESTISFNNTVSQPLTLVLLSTIAPFPATFATYPFLTANVVSDERFQSFYLSNITTSSMTANINLNTNTYEIPNAATNNGQYASMAILADGCPAVSYLDSSSSVLCFSKNTSPDGLGPWSSNIVDPTNSGYFTSMQVLPDYSIGIAYRASTTILKFARNAFPNGNGIWTTIVVTASANSNTYASLIICGDGTPGISYYDSTSSILRFAYNSSTTGFGTWSTIVVDATLNSRYNAAAVLLTPGLPGIAYWRYYDLSSRLLYFATNSAPNGSGTWTLNNTGNFDTNVTLAFLNTKILSSGNPGVIFNDGSNNDYCQLITSNNQLGTSWTVVNSFTSVFPSLTVMNNGDYFIAGIDTEHDQLRGFYPESSILFGFQVIDNVGTSYSNNSIMPLFSGELAVAYYESTSAKLKFARAPFPTGFVQDTTNIIMTIATQNII